MNKFPKYLVEIDWNAQNFEPALPTRPLWVARLRDPWVLARVEADARIYESAHPAARVTLWPAIVDARKSRGALIDKLVRVLFREHDIFEGEWNQPIDAGIALEPPEFLWCVRPDSEAEFILDPHAPRLWRVQIRWDEIASGATWWQGFGVAPQFPEDLRRISAFIKKSETGD